MEAAGGCGELCARARPAPQARQQEVEPRAARRRLAQAQHRAVLAGLFSSLQEMVLSRSDSPASKVRGDDCLSPICRCHRMARGRDLKGHLFSPPSYGQSCPGHHPSCPWAPPGMGHRVIDMCFRLSVGIKRCQHVHNFSLRRYPGSLLLCSCQLIMSNLLSSLCIMGLSCGLPALFVGNFCSFFLAVFWT